MAQYMLLLFADESGWAHLSPEEMKGAMAAYGAYNQALTQAGVLRDGHQLQPSKTAKTVKSKDGKSKTTDGPFAESKEQLGGYYVLEVASEADALAWAAKCPILFGGGTVEVRALIPRVG